MNPDRQRLLALLALGAAFGLEPVGRLSSLLLADLANLACALVIALTVPLIVRTLIVRRWVIALCSALIAGALLYANAYYGAWLDVKIDGYFGWWPEKVAASLVITWAPGLIITLIVAAIVGRRPPARPTSSAASR